MALDIRVESTRAVHEGSDFVLYQVRVASGQWNHTVEKRYSQFLELHRVMKMRYHSTRLEKLPKFPGKKVLKQVFGGLTQRDIEERRSRLEVYMRELENNACTKDSHYFLEFLQLPKPVAGTWMRYRNSVELSRSVKSEHGSSI